VVQIPAEVAEGIADAAPIVWSELWLRLCHGPILPGRSARGRVLSALQVRLLQRFGRLGSLRLIPTEAKQPSERPPA
jgi:hypothetical protein